MLRFMAKMSVKAPFTGVIVELPYYTKGTRIASGSHMVTLMGYNQMYHRISTFLKNTSPI